MKSRLAKNNIHSIMYSNRNIIYPDDEIRNTADLLNLKDSVGEENIVSTTFNVDYPQREAPFLYIDGEIIKGTSLDSHTSVLNQWMEEKGYGHVGEEWARVESNEIKKTINKESVGFGHIDRNMAFIENCDNCSPQEVLKSLLSDGNYKKTYQWEREENKVTRLAKNKTAEKNLELKLWKI